MPQYDGKPVLTIGKAEACRKTADEWFDYYFPAYDRPVLRKPGHEGPMWVLTLEGGPEDWPLLISGSIGDMRATWPAGVFAEPVNSWCLALYPADNPADRAEGEQLAAQWETALATGNQWAQERVGAQMAKFLREH